MIASLRGRTAVLFSSHLSSDVERICDQPCRGESRSFRAFLVKDLREMVHTWRIWVLPEAQGPHPRPWTQLPYRC